MSIFYYNDVCIVREGESEGDGDVCYNRKKRIIKMI